VSQNEIKLNVKLSTLWNPSRGGISSKRRGSIFRKWAAWLGLGYVRSESSLLGQLLGPPDETTLKIKDREINGPYILPNNKICDLENKDLSGKQMWVWFPHILLQLPSRVPSPPIPNDFDKIDWFSSTFLNSTLLQDNGWHFHSKILSNLYIISFQHMSRIKHVLPQLRHMKHRMKVCQLRGESYLISHQPNPPRDLIGVKKLRRQLPWAESPSHTGGSDHPQEHMITRHQLQGSPSTVCISLLPTLKGLHPNSHHSDFLSSLF